MYPLPAALPSFVQILRHVHQQHVPRPTLWADDVGRVTQTRRHREVNVLHWALSTLTVILALTLGTLAMPAYADQISSVQEKPTTESLAGNTPRAGAPSSHTRVLAVGSFPTQPNADDLKKILPLEVSETVRLYLGGRIDNWYRRQDRDGVVFIVNASSVDEARKILETLPMGRVGMMRFDLIPIGPLEPLRALLLPSQVP